MGSFILIIPILAFSVWLLIGTGNRLLREARATGQWLRVAAIVVAGIALGWWFTFSAEYKMGATLRLHSFPVPTVFIYLQDNQWVKSPLPAAIQFAVRVTDFLFGIALAVFPFKIVEFVKQVKAAV
jgi:hypothetical protein